MRDGWELVKLSEVCDLQNGFAFKSKSYVANSNTLNIRMSNIRPNGLFDPEHNIRFLPDSFGAEYSQYELHEGDLIIAMTDMAGNPKILGLPTLVKSLNNRTFLLNQRVGKLHHFSDNLHVPFLRYCLASSSIKEYYKSKGMGGLQLNISKKDVLSVQLPLPPLGEQKRIVAILDEAFAGIDQAVANTEKNLANARELFESYLNNIFTQKGEGWEEKTLNEIADTVSGHSFKSGDFSESNPVKSIKITNVGVKEFVEDESSKLPEIFSVTYKRFSISKNSIVIALTRTIISSGLKVAIVPSSFDGALLNQRVASVTAIPKYSVNMYLYYYLCSEIVVDYVIEKANTLMQPNLSIVDLKNMNIPIPSISIQHEVVNRIKNVESHTLQIINLYTLKLQHLAELKQSILQKAFAGELTADTVEEALA